MFLSVSRVLSGISLFVFGLNFISENAAKAAVGEKATKFLRSAVKRPAGGLFAGVILSAILQSGSAASMIAVSLVGEKTISFFNAACVIAGANIGSTATAHLLSLSAAGGVGVCCFMLLIGLYGRFCKSITLKSLGNVFIGTGVLFFGVEAVKNGISAFKDLRWFRIMFLGDKEWLLFLNGIILAACLQSSSAVTFVCLALAAKNLLPFYNSVFLVLGANVGSCVPVLLLSVGKNEEAGKTALFNLLFNLFGAVFFFFAVVCFRNFFVNAFSSSVAIGTAIARFNTFFNIIPALAFLCFAELRELKSKGKKCEKIKKSEIKLKNAV